jgi:hypothetical protein
MARTQKDKPKVTPKTKPGKGGAAAVAEPEPPMLVVRVRMEGNVKLRAKDLTAAKAKLENDFTKGRGIWMGEEATLSFPN